MPELAREATRETRRAMKIRAAVTAIVVLLVAGALSPRVGTAQPVSPGGAACLATARRRAAGAVRIPRTGLSGAPAGRLRGSGRVRPNRPAATRPPPVRRRVIHQRRATRHPGIPP